MKILFITCAYDGGRSGISVYMREVLSRLINDQEVTVIATAKDYASLPRDERIKYQVLPPVFNFAVMNMLYVLLLPFFVKVNTFDFILFPAANRRMMAFKKGYSVGVIHDLSQYHIKAKYDCLRMFFIQHILPRIVIKLDQIVAISQSTANDVVQYWNVPKTRITLNYNGLNRKQYNLQKSEKNIQQVLEKYAITEPFILYISRIEHPGKNHFRLIQAYEKLPETIKSRNLLVLAGSAWSGAEVVYEYAQKSPDSKRIRFIGFVPNEEVPPLYHAANVYVFPSLFEGFGLSIPEAWACGCVICCSNNSSLGEIAADAAIQFDPTNVDEIYQAIHTLIVDTQKRDELHQKALKRVQLFDWDLHVKKLIELGKMRNDTSILGVKYTNTTYKQVLENVCSIIENKERKIWTFVNADCLNQAYSNEKYNQILKNFDAVYPDGSGLHWASRYIGKPRIENINGTDLFPMLASLAEEKEYKLFLFGAQKGVAKKMANNIEKQYPKLKIVGTHAGFNADHVIEQINTSKADIVLVALGVPLQENWIIDHVNDLNVHLLIGVGGLFDFYSGRIPRAPLLLRRCGMEWFFRFLMEPNRMFKRYILGNPLFILRVIKHGRRGRYE